MSYQPVEKVYPTKFCVDCQHHLYRKFVGDNLCLALIEDINPVTSRISYSSAYYARTHDCCGIEAKLFEPKNAVFSIFDFFKPRNTI